MAFLSSTLGSIFFSSWICSKRTFSTTLKPTMVHECQEGFQFFHLKKQTFHCFLSLKPDLFTKELSEECLQEYSFYEGIKIVKITDWQKYTKKKINKWCCLLPWEQSWCFMFWFLPFPSNKNCSVLFPSLQVSTPWEANSTEQNHLQRTPVQKTDFKTSSSGLYNWGTPD